MKRLAKVVAVVMVLAAALTFSNTALMAAPTHGAAMAADRGFGIGLFQTFLRLIGFASGDINSATALPHAGSPRPITGVGGTATGGFSSQPSTGLKTDTAIWGRCQLPPC